MGLIETATTTSPLPEPAALLPEPAASSARWGQARLLLVDDEPEARRQLRRYLELDIEQADWAKPFDSVSIEEAPNGDAALALIPRFEPMVLMTDVTMPGMDGVELLKRVRGDFPHVQCVIFTGHGDTALAIEALRAGASDYLRKPLEMEEVEVALDRALGRWRTSRELEARGERLEALVQQRTAQLNASNEELRQQIKASYEFEAQLRQRQKLEAIGTLAGGIAHDFNNILTAILGYTEMCQGDVPEASRAGHNLEEILNAGARAKELVRQILTFSRRNDSQRQPVLLAPLIKEAIKLLRASLPSTVEIRQNLNGAGETTAVQADPTQIHQVLLNLCTNASHALRESGGVLEVTLTPCAIRSEAGLHDAARPRRDSPDGASSERLGIAPGDYVKLTVRDTGCGMDRTTMGRIFEPFFTTKDVEVGTGMGLAVVHGIVSDHGGAITVHSRLGHGATFRVYLPQTRQPEAIRPTRTTPTGLQNIEPKPRERILFVDDEPCIAELGRQMLERRGFRVTARSAPDRALKDFLAAPEAFDLVVTDLTMPGIPGDVLIGDLLRVRPDLPVIICTGFSERLDPEKARKLGACELLMKPLLSHELEQAVERALTPRN